MSEATYKNPFTIKGNGKKEKLKVKDLVRDKRLQARKDIDTDSEVDELRAQGFAEAMKKGAKFPEVTVFRVKDAPGQKKETTLDLIVDGMHTHRAYEINKTAECECIVHEGTWTQALNYAATVSNRQHEANGKPLSTKDKLHAVEILCRAYKDSDIPKKDWPSNRELSRLICGSDSMRQFINTLDPFDRAGGPTRDQINANKRADRAINAAKNHLNPKAPPHFDIVQKTTGQKVASYDAKDEAEALEKHKAANKDADMKAFVARKAEAPPKAGSEKAPVGFDWAGMEGHVGYLVRGLDGMADMFNLKATPEYKAAFANIDGFAKFVQDMRKKHGGKKPAAAAASPAA